MRTEPLNRELTAGEEAPNDIQLMMQATTLLAGIAIAIAMMGCDVSDEADLHAAPAEQNTNVAHATPQEGATQGNVQDMTY
jgi:hypothetical protein